MVPKGWSLLPLSLVTKLDKAIVYGIVQAGLHTPGGVPYIKSTDVVRDIDPKSLQCTSNEIAKKYKRAEVYPGDIVFSLRGNIGETCIVPTTLPRANLTHGTARISVDNHHSNEFVYYALSSPLIKKRISIVAKGSTFREISLEELRKLEILLPPLPEQQKIAQILSTWDRAIDTLDALIAAKQKRKTALMQQLLTGKRRLPGFGPPAVNGHLPERWIELKLGSVATLQRGFDLPQQSRIDGFYPIVSSGGISGYHSEAKVKGPGVVTGKYGSIGDVFYINDDYWPLNTSLWIKDFHSNYRKFIYYLLCTVDFKKLSDKTGVPGVNRNDAHRLIVKLPPLPEQQKIAAVLSTTDREIDTHQRQLDALKTQKKGLMQQLLTGKKRVVLDAPNPALAAAGG